MFKAAHLKKISFAVDSGEAGDRLYGLVSHEIGGQGRLELAKGSLRGGGEQRAQSISLAEEDFVSFRG